VKKPSTLDLRAAASPSVTPRKRPVAPPDTSEDTDVEPEDTDGDHEDTDGDRADVDFTEDTGEIDADDDEDTGEISEDTDEDADEAPPQVADSPGNRAYSRTTVDDSPDLHAGPDVSGAASEGTVVFGGEWGSANDLMRQWRDTLGKSTAKLYVTHLHRFFSWCANQGWTPASLPEDALIQYSSTLIPTYGQFVVSGLKSFVKGGYASHLQLSALEYPRIKRPPARKKQKEEDMSEELPEVQHCYALGTSHRTSLIATMSRNSSLVGNPISPMLSIWGRPCFDLTRSVASLNSSKLTVRDGALICLTRI